MRAVLAWMGLAATVACGAAEAQAKLLNRSELVEALTASPQCCIIDARSARERRQDPLGGALLWRDDLKINPTANVVVIADQDETALGVARRLGERHPGTPILAVRGGLPAWKAVTLTLTLWGSADTATGPAASFVIPSNTCEQGKPLQVIRSKQK